jgi:hypothetical protein
VLTCLIQHEAMAAVFKKILVTFWKISKKLIKVTGNSGEKSEKVFKNFKIFPWKISLPFHHYLMIYQNKRQGPGFLTYG